MDDTANAFTARNAPYIRLDINVEWRMNWQHSTLTIFANVLNVLNIQNLNFRHLVLGTNGAPATISYEYDIPIIPVAGIRYEF